VSGQPGEWEPAPAPAEDTVGGYLAQVAAAARERAGAWDAVADVLAGDVRTAQRLRDGSAAAAWRASSRWLGDDAELFVADLISLDVYQRGAARRTVEDDLAALATDHAALVAPHVAVVAHVRDVADACRAEAEAWSAGDPAGGKALRLRQQELIETHLVPVLPDLGGRLVREAGMGVWRALGRLVLAVLSVESGRDYQRAVLGDDLGRHRA
jgi:hypothetical protein